MRWWLRARSTWILHSHALPGDSPPGGVKTTNPPKNLEPPLPFLPGAVNPVHRFVFISPDLQVFLSVLPVLYKFHCQVAGLNDTPCPRETARGGDGSARRRRPNHVGLRVTAQKLTLNDVSL